MDRWMRRGAVLPGMLTLLTRASCQLMMNMPVMEMPSMSRMNARRRNPMLTNMRMFSTS